MFKVLFRIVKFREIKIIPRRNQRSVTWLSRSFHSSSYSNPVRQLIGQENQFMYNVLRENVVSSLHVSKVNLVETEQEFNDVLNETFRINSGKSISDILEVFKRIQNYCILNNIQFSDKRFDNLIDGLMDHAETLTDNQLLELLRVLANFPKCESYKDHNFHDLWSCLDDISTEKIPERSIEYLLNLGDAWFQLGLGRVGDFLYKLIDSTSRKAGKLSKKDLLHIFFFMNVCRKYDVAFEYEEALEKYLNEFTVDEFGIIALAYFKTMNKIKLDKITLAMIEKVKKESKTINQITLTSILKVLRYSKPGKLIVEINEMLDSLVSEIERFSPQCCLHIAIIGTGLLHFHRKTLEKSVQKLVNLMDNPLEVRLKDIERIINATTMVDFRPDVKPDLYETALNALKNENRQPELELFPRILPCILNYLSIFNIYSYELMDRVLNTNFITETYGKGIAVIPRDIFLLDACIDIECPDYKGQRLCVNTKYRLAKWIIEFTPTKNQYKKLTAYDNLYLDTVKTIEEVVGDKKLVRADHVVPHFARADIILCKDMTKNEFIEPIGFERYILGDIKYAFNDPNLFWYAISVVGWNNTIRNTSLPVGMLVMKQRHLKKIGYNPKMVIWNQFMTLSREGKTEYIRRILS